jgi:hypothetical protein
MAVSAQRDQILFLVGTRLAAEFEMVHLQLMHAPAGLTPPAVSLQDLTV